MLSGTPSVEFEQHLHRNGTRVDSRFSYHLCRKEKSNRKRFLARLDDPPKNWSFSLCRTLQERKYWKDYMQSALRSCLSATSTRTAPWHIVPADDKQNARLIVSQTLLHALKGLDLAYPKPDEARLKELRSIRELLA